MMLLSKVKEFNMRFKSRYLATSDPELMYRSQRFDARQTKEFKVLDDLIETFGKSFPKGLRDPIVGNIVDPHRLSACLVPHV